jgi:hypothetical protein
LGKHAWRAAGAASLAALAALACNADPRILPATTAAPPPPNVTAAAPAATAQATATPAPSATTPLDTATPEETARPAATALPEGACLEPPEDYTEVIINGETISQRTYWMLERAKEIYPGPGDLLRVTQGSFRNDLDSSFGTHAGGGAVDISIRDPADNTYLFSETGAMVRALRLAGFAAWYREPGSLGTGSPPHIHAIAVGDRDLSPAAHQQLHGEAGYFDGMDGLVPPYGPNPDPYGGPIVCEWMNE